MKPRKPQVLFWKTYALSMEIYNDAATMENSMKFPKEIKKEGPGV